jgi:hypothetical protein
MSQMLERVRISRYDELADMKQKHQARETSDRLLLLDDCSPTKVVSSVLRESEGNTKLARKIILGHLEERIQRIGWDATAAKIECAQPALWQRRQLSSRESARENNKSTKHGKKSGRRKKGTAQLQEVQRNVPTDQSRNYAYLRRRETQRRANNARTLATAKGPKLQELLDGPAQFARPKSAPFVRSRGFYSAPYC